MEGRRCRVWGVIPSNCLSPWCYVWADFKQPLMRIEVIQSTSSAPPLKTSKALHWNVKVFPSNQNQFKRPSFKEKNIYFGFLKYFPFSLGWFPPHRCKERRIASRQKQTCLTETPSQGVTASADSSSISQHTENTTLGSKPA